MVGYIDFDEAEAALRQNGFQRLPSGFMLTLPARLTLDWQPGTWRPMVSSLHARVFIDDNSGIELGLAEDRKWYSPANPRLENHDLALQLRGSLEALQIIEKRRNGAAPKLWVQISGEVCPTFKAKLDGAADEVRGVPEQIWGELHLQYPQETWGLLVDSVGLMGNVLVEIPVRKEPPERWKKVFAAADEARRQLARGGEDAWKASIMASRLALEEWRAIEIEERGKGWGPPKMDERETLSKRERLDGVRWALLQVAHLAAHSSAEKWTRNDAVCVFATLAALLASRDP